MWSEVNLMTEGAQSNAEINQLYKLKTYRYHCMIASASVHVSLSSFVAWTTFLITERFYRCQMSLYIIIIITSPWQGKTNPLICHKFFTCCFLCQSARNLKYSAPASFAISLWASEGVLGVVLIGIKLQTINSIAESLKLCCCQSLPYDTGVKCRNSFCVTFRKWAAFYQLWPAWLYS